MALVLRILRSDQFNYSNQCLQSEESLVILVYSICAICSSKWSLHINPRPDGVWQVTGPDEGEGAKGPLRISGTNSWIVGQLPGSCRLSKKSLYDCRAGL